MAILARAILPAGIVNNGDAGSYIARNDDA